MTQNDKDFLGRSISPTRGTGSSPRTTMSSEARPESCATTAASDREARNKAQLAEALAEVGRLQERAKVANQERLRCLEATRQLKGSIRIMGRIRPPVQGETSSHVLQPLGAQQLQALGGVLTCCWSLRELILDVKDVIYPTSQRCKAAAVTLSIPLMVTLQHQLRELRNPHLVLPTVGRNQQCQDGTYLDRGERQLDHTLAPRDQREVAPGVEREIQVGANDRREGLLHEHQIPRGQLKTGLMGQGALVVAKGEQQKQVKAEKQRTQHYHH
eukprot:s284_g20.t1